MSLFTCPCLKSRINIFSRYMPHPEKCFITVILYYLFSSDVQKPEFMHLFLTTNDERNNINLFGRRKIFFKFPIQKMAAYMVFAGIHLSRWSDG